MSNGTIEIHKQPQGQNLLLIEDGITRVEQGIVDKGADHYGSMVSHYRRREPAASDDT